MKRAPAVRKKATTDPRDKPKGPAKTKKKAPSKAVTKKAQRQVKVSIPPVEVGRCRLKFIGTSPLMTNMKGGEIAYRLARKYGGEGGKSGAVEEAPLTADERYACAFYTMPSSKYPAPHVKGKYGVPASGIRKCLISAIRCTGITDNTTISLIRKSFKVLAEEGGLVEIHHKGFVRDVRPVPKGKMSGAMELRHRPMFKEWFLYVTVEFNPKTLTVDQMVNLGMHGGVYIGLCEMREEKSQGECGGFRVAKK
jgi:hypothetical protein